MLNFKTNFIKSNAVKTSHFVLIKKKKKICNVDSDPH